MSFFAAKNHEMFATLTLEGVISEGIHDNFML